MSEQTRLEPLPIIGQYTRYDIKTGQHHGGFFIQLPGQDLLREASLYPRGQLFIRELRKYESVELYSGQPREFLLTNKNEIIKYHPVEGRLEDLCETRF